MSSVNCHSRFLRERFLSAAPTSVGSQPEPGIADGARIREGLSLHPLRRKQFGEEFVVVSQAVYQLVPPASLIHSSSDSLSKASARRRRDGSNSASHSRNRSMNAATSS